MSTFISEGLIVQLTVGTNSTATDSDRKFDFRPEFVKMDEQIKFRKSVRIFRIEELGNRKLHEGEIWNVRVNRIEPDPKGRLTKDKRRRVYVYIQLVARVEKTTLTYDPVRQTLLEKCLSGEHLIRRQPTSASIEPKIYRDGDTVIKIDRIKAGDRILYGKPKEISAEEYSRELQEKVRSSTFGLKQAMKTVEGLPTAPKEVLDTIANGEYLYF